VRAPSKPLRDAVLAVKPMFVMNYLYTYTYVWVYVCHELCIYEHICNLLLQAAAALAAMKADENVSNPDVALMAYTYMYICVYVCMCVGR